MSRHNGLRVLAIGLDAAEPTLVQRLIEQGKLPSLGDLLARGIWGTVRSPADIGSGTVWPTFMTGTGPFEHGIYSVMPWDARAMSLVRLSTDHLTPFWAAMARAGHAVGVLDVPFAPLVGFEHGIEISEWGAHDRLRGQMRVSPADRHAWLAGIAAEHPLGSSRVEVSSPRDSKALRELATRCRDGARLRGDLMARLIAELRLDVLVAVFSEIHHASHYLWHTLDQDDVPRAGRVAGQPITPNLVDVYREVDGQIGRLVDLAGSEAMVLIFSLHGMRATEGIPTILDPLLHTMGFVAEKGWRARTWPERRQWVTSAVREAAPAPLRRLYRKAASTTLRTPQAERRLPYDWSRTAAFPIPTDQHGWIRLNLQGRESGGILDRARYEEACVRLERTLLELKTTNGGRVVSRVIRIDREAGGPSAQLPDLVVHWDDGVLAGPLRIASPRLSAPSVGRQFTGQHAQDGFFLLRPAAGRPLTPGKMVAAEILHRVVQAALET